MPIHKSLYPFHIISLGDFKEEIVIKGLFSKSLIPTDICQTTFQN